MTSTASPSERTPQSSSRFAIHAGLGAAGREVGDVLVDAADVAVARLAREAKLRRRALRGRRLEERALEQHSRGAGGDSRVLSAHYAGDGVGRLRVADHEHGRVELALNAVEGLHRLAVARVADDYGEVLQLRVVEGMHRLAELKHHVVRDVDRKAERADAAQLKAFGHEVGRRSVRRHLRDDAGSVPEALSGVFDSHLDLVVDVNAAFFEVHRRKRDRSVQNRAELAGEADDGKRVGAVPGDLDVEDDLGLLELGDVAHQGAGGRLGRVLDDAGVALADVELLLGAAHAEALHAAELALLDLLGLAVLVEELGDRGADLGKGCLDALAHVRRAADDLEGLLAVRHLADVQVVGVRVRLALEHLGDDDEVGERVAAYGLDGLDLEAGAGELLGEFVRVEVVDLDVVVKPAERDFHLE